ncbi:MAG: hypothetical protein E7H33_09565 [Clostridium perfringens]|nr:hypothetical protein [Clostridium perfringens]
MREENKGFENKDLVVDWSKFKSNASGKVLQDSKKGYIEFCKMLNEVDFELVSDYVGNKEKVELVYKFNNSVKLNIKPDNFKRQTYKSIINFKNKLIKNGDEFVKFVGLTNDGNSLVTKINTFDGGKINLDITTYSRFIKARQDFYNKLKEVNGYTPDYYIRKDIKMNIYIDDVKLNPMTSNDFKSSTYKTIINFKNSLKINGDKFIKFTGLTNGGRLIVQIKTFDNGVIDIDMGSYINFNNGRQDFYNKLKEVGGYTNDFYINNETKMNICVDDVKLNPINPNDFKTSTYKNIIKFKNKLKENNDSFIKFIELTNDGNLIVRIKTFDDGLIDIDIANYNSWNKGRKDFYDKLKEVGGYTYDYYKGSNEKINILINDVKLNSMRPNDFKRITYKAIVNLKFKLKENGDEFVKFIGLTNGGNFIANIQTIDDGEIDIDIRNYCKWNKSRQDTYGYCKSKNYKILSSYVGNKYKILIDFNCGHKPNWIAPSNLKSGQCCPICKESKGEKAIRLYLEKNNIEFKQEYRFDDCRLRRSLPFDFYIPKYNLCIEFDGEQHYKANDFFGEESFKETQKRDKIKNDYCRENNINLIRIPYWELDNVESILNEEFGELRKQFKEAC